MDAATVIRLFTEGDVADEQLVREYVLSALPRLRARDDCTDVRFSRFGMDPRWEKSEVRLAIYGDLESLVTEEMDRWDALERDGLIRGWEQIEPPFEKMPEELHQLYRDLSIIGANAAEEVYNRFDSRPDPSHELYRGGPLDDGFGWWVVFHYLSNSAGYGPEEEVEAYLAATRDRVISITEFHDHDHARDVIEGIRDSLDDLESKVNELEEQGGFGYGDGPFPDE